ncbi:MAG: tRNA 4-thiouridine(8) synthase ThiI [Clostridia bacterium]|nr:tRNA 4-thiouridine(8) synthase ThiI [Clostridia bacterium]
MTRGRRVLLVRYGEVALKGQNRRAFEDALVGSLKERARRAGLDVAVLRSPGRLFLVPPASAPGPGEAEDGRMERLLSVASRVFGVVSLSPAVEAPLEWDAIVEAALQVARPVRARGAPTFKVEARRANKGFPLTSPEIARELGRALASGLDWPVDVARPAATVEVEVREKAYVFAETIPGPGGLPAGTAGRGVLLLSGGIDSPVAGWLVAKRGLQPRAVYFHTPPYTGEKAREKVRTLCRTLAGWLGAIELDSVPFTSVSEAVFRAGPDRLGTVLMRRFMMRVASRIAERVGAEALVTGESLGQVASQTLPSIAAIDEAASLPVLRPLIGLDKSEIVALARRIGTYETSILPHLDCCSVFVPRHPATRPRLADCLRAEARLPVEDLVASCLSGVETELVSA